MFSKLFPKEEVQPDGSRSRSAGRSRTTGSIRIQYPIESIRIQCPIGSLRIQLRRRFLERTDFFYRMSRQSCPFLQSELLYKKNGQDFLNVQYILIRSESQAKIYNCKVSYSRVHRIKSRRGRDFF